MSHGRLPRVCQHTGCIGVSTLMMDVDRRRRRYSLPQADQAAVAFRRPQSLTRLVAGIAVKRYTPRRPSGLEAEKIKALLSSQAMHGVSLSCIYILLPHSLPVQLLDISNPDVFNAGFITCVSAVIVSQRNSLPMYTYVRGLRHSA